MINRRKQVLPRIIGFNQRHLTLSLYWISWKMGVSNPNTRPATKSRFIQTKHRDTGTYLNSRLTPDETYFGNVIVSVDLFNL